MRRVVLCMGIMLLWPAVAGAKPVTTERGARATLKTDSIAATITVSETATIAGEPQPTGSLELTIGEIPETLACTYSWSDDPVITGAAELKASCAPYDVVANFTVTGGGRGEFPLVCAANFSRASDAKVEVTREGELVVSGTTHDSRVWTNVDFGVC
jgi:hypothetical protein